MKRDIFILVPIAGKLRVKKDVESEILIDKFVSVINETAKYECERLINESIHRMAYDKISLAYMDDNYEEEKAEWIDVYTIISYQEYTQLGVVQLYIPQCDKSATQIGDMVSSEHLIVKKNGCKYTLEQFLFDELGVFICGKNRVLYCMDRTDVDKIELEYMLAGEMYNSKHTETAIKNASLTERANTNLSSYDFYDLYASTNAIIYCIDNYSNDAVENMDKEALLLFICEIAVLQNAAINRINKMIVAELLENSDISARKTLKLQVEFGKTILLWDNNIYNYYMAQQVSDKIIEAFETDKLYVEYQKNKSHIEQIASVKSGIASEMEGRVLNILAFILSISELVQLVDNIKSYILGVPGQYVLLGGSTAALIVVLVAIIKNRKRKKLDL